MSFDFDSFFAKGAQAQGYNAQTAGDTGDLEKFAKTHSDYVDPHIYDAAEQNYGPGSKFYADNNKPASQPFDLGSLFGGVKDFAQSTFGPIGEAANAYENARETNTPDLMGYLGSLGGLASSIGGIPGNALNYFSGHNTPVLGGASQALETLFSPTNAAPGAFALAAGQQAAQEGFGEGYKTLEGGTPAPYDLPALLRALGSAGQATAEYQGSVAQDPNASPAERAAAGAFSTGLQAAPYVVPIPGLHQVLGRFGREADAARPAEAARIAEDVTPALPAPERLALPEGAIPQGPGPIPMRSPDFRGDVTSAGRVRFPQSSLNDILTARPNDTGTFVVEPPRDISTDEGFRQQIRESLDRQRANPTPIEELGNRFPISARDSGAGAYERPLSLNEILAQRRQANVPLDAEQMAAERGEVTPAQAQHLAGLADEVAAREQERAARPLTSRGITTTPVSREDLGLTGRRFQEPVPTMSADELRARTGAPERLTTPSGYTLDQRATQVHYANEDFIAAVRRAAEAPNARAAAEHWQAANDAAQKVRDLGGSLDHTLARARREGLPVPTPSQLPALSRPRAEAVGALTEQGVLKPRTFVRNLSDDALKAELARRTTANEAAQQRYASLTRARSPLAADAARAAQGAAKSLDAVRKEITARGGSNAEVPTGRAGGARGLGNLVRGEAGSTTLENALGVGVARRLGLTDLFRGIGERVGNFNREQGGEVPLTRERAAEIRAERKRGPENIDQSFDRLVGNAGKPQEASAQSAFAGQRGPNAPRPTGARVLPNVPRAPRRFSLNDLVAQAPRAAGAGVREGVGLLKSGQTALAPLHALDRHLSPIGLSHPIAYAKAAKTGATTFGNFLKNPTKARATMGADIARMKRNLAANSQPRDFGKAPTGAARVEIRNPHGSYRAGEDFVPSQLLNKIPLVGRAVEGSQAAFSMTQNAARYEAVKGSINQYSKLLGRPLTEAEKGGIADRINHFSGRGFRTEGDVASKVGAVSNVFAYSPQLQTSYARMVGDLAHAVAHPKSIESLETLRLAGGLMGRVAIYAGVASALGLSVDLNPQSGNFLKVDLGSRDAVRGGLAGLASQFGGGVITESNGHVYLDLTHGMAGYVKAVAQTAKQAGGPNPSFHLDLGLMPKYDPNNVGTPAGNVLKNHLGPGVYDLNELRLGNQVKPLNDLLPISATGAAEAAGWNPPTAQLTGGHLFKGQDQADIQIPVGSTPAPTKGTRTGGAAPTRRPTSTARPAPTRRP